MHAPTERQLRIIRRTAADAVQASCYLLCQVAVHFSRPCAGPNQLKGHGNQMPYSYGTRSFFPLFFSRVEPPMWVYGGLPALLHLRLGTRWRIRGYPPRVPQSQQRSSPAAETRHACSLLSYFSVKGGVWLGCTRQDRWDGRKVHNAGFAGDQESAMNVDGMMNGHCSAQYLREHQPAQTRESSVACTRPGSHMHQHNGGRLTELYRSTCAVERHASVHGDASVAACASLATQWTHQKC